MPDADPLVALPDTDRQYHIDLAPGEVADYILLPGDPDRIERIAALLDDVEVRRRIASSSRSPAATGICASRSSRRASARTTSRS